MGARSAQERSASGECGTPWRAKQLALKQVIQLPKPLWREILELCGGELKSAAARAYGEEDDAN